MKNIKFIITGLVFVIAIVIGVTMYNKPHLDVAKTTVDYQLTAKNLLNEFVLDETIADTKFANTVIEVTGVIVETVTDSNKKSIVLKGKEANVICQLNDQIKMDLFTKLNTGQSITIKGQCAGFLMDVMLVNCIIKN